MIPPNPCAAEAAPVPPNGCRPLSLTALLSERAGRVLLHNDVGEAPSHHDEPRMPRGRRRCLRSSHDHPVRRHPVVGARDARTRGGGTPRKPPRRLPSAQASTVPRRGIRRGRAREPAPRTTARPSRRRAVDRVGRRGRPTGGGRPAQPTWRCSGRSRPSRHPGPSPTCSSTATGDSGSIEAREPSARRRGRPTRTRCARSPCGSSHGAAATSTRPPPPSTCGSAAASACMPCCRPSPPTARSSRCGCRGRRGSRSPRSRAPAWSTRRRRRCCARRWPAAATCS